MAAKPDVRNIWSDPDVGTVRFRPDRTDFSEPRSRIFITHSPRLRQCVTRVRLRCHQRPITLPASLTLSKFCSERVT